MKRRGAFLTLVAVLAMGPTGCDLLSSDDDPEPSALEAVSGAPTSGTVGQALSSPLRVRVVTSSGDPVPNATVNWAVEQGGGSISPTQSSANNDGVASATLTLGTTAGVNRVRATVGQLPAVTFNVTGQADRPANVNITPGDIVLDALGATAQLSASATDQHGNTVSGVSAQWSSSAGGVASVNNTGRVTAVSVGETTVEAVMDTARATVNVTVQQVVASVVVDPASATITDEETVQLTATANDANDNPVADAQIVWSSNNEAAATVDGDGLVTGVAPGSATIQATADGVTGESAISVISADAPVITSISPDTLVPLGTATIAGENFGPAPGDNAVTVRGVAVTVLTASTTELTVELPPQSSFGCIPTGEAVVEVDVAGATGSRPHMLSVAPRLDLQPGESVALLDAADVRCNELVDASGRYVVSVLNTSTSADATSAFRLRGEVTGAAPDAVAVRTAASPRPAAQTPVPSRRALWANPELHNQIMEQNAALHERLRHEPTPAALRAAGQVRDVDIAASAVGDTITVRVPRQSDLCNAFDQIQARVVFVGARSILAEDVQAPMAGQIDEDYEGLGEDFENTIYGIITTNFGDPLALDSQLSNTGRVLMVFSPRVNDSGVPGFVTNADFFASCPSSDMTQVFYGWVPRTTSPQAVSRADWEDSLGALTTHEVKHLAMMTERTAQGHPLEHVWLEEATARTAEEFWGRAVYGYAQHENTGFQDSVRCEWDLSATDCPAHRLVMVNHFSGLAAYYGATETHSVLGPTAAGPGTFYDSGWSFVRWAADHYGADEAQFFTALTQTSLQGVANLATRTGRTFAEMLADWSLAAAVDDLPEFNPARDELTYPSWNHRDVMAGMHSLGLITSPWPLATRNHGFGNFDVQVNQIRGGTVSIFDLSGATAGSQLLELMSTAGGAPPGTLRIAIVRVE